MQDRHTSPAGRILMVLAVAAALLIAVPPLPGAHADGNEATDIRSALQARLSGGIGHTCALLDTAGVKCWGQNSRGQLGVGDTIDRGDQALEMGANLATVPFGAISTVKAISAGGNFTCALLLLGQVKCWGANDSGQLGIGAFGDRGGLPNQLGDALPAVDLGAGRTAVAIAAGQAHACAILDNGQLKCWGLNDSAQLGLRDFLNRGNISSQMGDALPAVDLGTGRTAIGVATGYNHTCAVLDNGQAKCWGANSNGELGQGDKVQRGISEATIGDNLPPINLGTGRTARMISAGFGFTCAVLDNAQAKCWGRNDLGQLGQGDSIERGSANLQMGEFLRPVDLGRTVLAISSGGAHTCALRDDLSVKCWGYNGVGNLGLGDAANRGDNPGEMGAALPTVALGDQPAVSVTTGENHACASLMSGNVKCWGLNERGQLGLGDVARRGDRANQMGSNLPVLSLAGTLSQRTKFVPVPPTRIFDTRTNGIGKLALNATTTVPVAGQGGVPFGASAVVANLTTTGTITGGFVTAFPADRTSPPLASNLNVARFDQTTANLVTVPLSGDGRMNVFTSAGGHMIVDVFGYYFPTAGQTSDGRFFPCCGTTNTQPARVFDTREGGGPKLAADVPKVVRIAGSFAPFGIPQGATALVLNVTATESDGAGHVTAYPADQARPGTSNLNIENASQTVANQVIVPVSADNEVAFVSSVGTHLVVDVSGYYSGTNFAVRGFGLFVPITPTRLLDTRTTSKVPAGGTAFVQIGDGNRPPASVYGAVLNVTGVDATAPGYVTVFPAAQASVPLASNLNLERVGQIVPNHVVVGADAGAVRIFSESGTHLVVDLYGFFIVE